MEQFVKWPRTYDTICEFCIDVDKRFPDFGWIQSVRYSLPFIWSIMLYLWYSIPVHCQTRNICGRLSIYNEKTWPLGDFWRETQNSWNSQRSVSYVSLKMVSKYISENESVGLKYEKVLSQLSNDQLQSLIHLKRDEMEMFGYEFNFDDLQSYSLPNSWL